MTNRIAGLAVTAVALLVPVGLLAAGQASAARQPARPAAQPAARTAAAQKLPPLSYICIMPGDEDVLEDHAGSCPKCKMDLVPVRLDAKFWCPVHQALEVHDAAGKCRRDGRDLVPVTLSVSWTCADAADKKLLEPGKCADGSARKIGYELRAHGDHNPRHGGQFFMASDAWHHIEGTYPENGLFRAYFYDNFTKPLTLRGKGIAGTLAIRDAKDKEIASVPLVAGKIGSAMEAKVPPTAAALPLRATVTLKFSAQTQAQPFDFQFNELSKDTTAGVAIGPTATPRVTAAPKPAAPQVAAATPAAAPATPAPQQPAVGNDQAAPQYQPPAGGPADLFAGEVAPMPPALAAVLNEDVLPKDVPGLLKELATRAAEIERLMREGSIGEVWLPAMGTKTVALVLDAHTASLAPARRAQATLAVKRVVAGAWALDGYGDLGNRAKVAEASEQMAVAVKDLQAAFGGNGQ